MGFRHAMGSRGTGNGRSRKGCSRTPRRWPPYSGDELPLEDLKTLPRAVVKPRTEEEAARIVSLCARTKVPVTARGGGTGLSGGCVPSDGGVVLSLERLNRVVERDPDTATITVEAGVPLSRLYEEVERMGLFFPPHPGDEGAFVGGVVATNAGGSRAVKYGTIRRFVLGLRVITASGRLIELGGKIIKSSSGYDLLDLMIGSEGTLGIVTRVTLALVPKPGIPRDSRRPVRERSRGDPRGSRHSSRPASCPARWSSSSIPPCAARSACSARNGRPGRAAPRS